LSTGSVARGASVVETAQSLRWLKRGAGYDSLVSTNSYIQDQCFTCAGITEFGDHVTLSGTTAEQLVTVVLAVRNWGTAITKTRTFTITTTVASPVSDTQSFSFPAASGPDSPSVTNVVFNFASQGAVVDHSFLYGISGLSTGLNVALSNSANDLVVGSDTTPGYVWVNTKYSTLGNDFPPCTSATTGVYARVKTNCGHASPSNPSAYGTTTEVNTTGNADIPAVEINVVGGTAPGLSPGGPAAAVNFAITNPGQTRVHVGHVTTSITSVSTAGTTTAIAACTATTYGLNNPTVTVDENVPPGTSLFNATGSSVFIKTSGTTQNNCEGAVIHLHFAS